MRTLTFTAISILILILSVQALACSQSHGKSEKDKQVAARICEVFKDNPHILMMSAQESILYVDISRTFYDEMMRDKLTSKELIKVWLRGMRVESGNRAVTVWIYVNKVKVIEGNTSWTGEDKFNFL